MAYQVRVRDSLAPRGHYIEDWDCATKDEALQWVKQFKAEYPKEDGYSITMKEI